MNGTHAKTIAKSQHYPAATAVGGSHLYWANAGTNGSTTPNNGTIVEANPNGAHAKTIAPHQHSPFGLAVGPSRNRSGGNSRRSRPHQHLAHRYKLDQQPSTNAGRKTAPPG